MVAMVDTGFSLSPTTRGDCVVAPELEIDPERDIWSLGLAVHTSLGDLPPLNGSVIR